MMLLIPLWTDIVLWAVCLSSIVVLVRSYRCNRHQRNWGKILRPRSTYCCASIVALYFGVALLDSIHLQTNSGNTGSALDFLLQVLPMQRERSYSEPFAIEQLNAERQVDTTGNVTRERRRLAFGGATLGSSNDRAGDISKRALTGAAIGGLLAIICIAITKRASITSHTSVQLAIIVLSACLGALVVLSMNYHILGTDKIGNDLIFRGLKGCRTAVILGVATTLIGTPIALVLGTLAGFRGGLWDDLVQYLYIVVGSIPGVLLIAAGMLVAQANLAGSASSSKNDVLLLWLSSLLALTGFPGLCRLVRAETLRMREAGFLTTARIIGASRMRIVLRHILPNLLPLIAVAMMLRFSGLVLSEAVLTYVGIGVDPSIESWGAMINAARFELAREPAIWWNFTTAMLFMLGLVLPINILGETVRDALDPTLRIQ
jgi:peptide/nickel transport system permease protein